MLARRRIGAALALLAALASFEAREAVTAKPKPPAAPADPTPGEVRTGKLARILRAADRRIVDADLLASLVDGDAAVRARAALALGQIGDAGSAAPLAKATGDKDAAVRAMAVFALGLLGDAAPRDPLHALAADPSPGVRASVAEALGRVRDPASRDRVLALLGDPDLAVRSQADLAAWKFADPSGLLDALVGNTALGDPRVRATAAYALARLASAPSAPPSSGSPVGHLSDADLHRARAALAARVADRDTEVRMQVARGLARPQNAGEIAIVGTLTSDRDPRVRVNAVKSLGFPGTPLRPYLERACADADPMVQRVALEALGKSCGGDVRDKLQELMLKYDDSWRREAVLTSLMECDPTQIPSVVDGLLENADPVMRLAALPMSAAHTESKGARKAILRLLADRDPRVQAAAVPVAVNEDAPLGPILAPLADAADPVVRAAVADAYGKRIEAPRPGTEPRETLLAALEALWARTKDDSLPDAKLSVLDAAAKAGKENQVKAFLDRALADRDVLVRGRAAKLYRDVFGEDRAGAVGPASDRPLADYEAIVRWSAVPHAAVITLGRRGVLPGRFTVALDAQAAPMTAWNFAQLAERKFYDARIVHRVVPNFVVQDGDPRGDGYGGPGYSIRDEWNPLRFSAGVAGMASDGKDTAGSQWFIVLSEQPHLDGRYTSFGRVVQGLGAIVGAVQPGDQVLSIRVYEGNGAEPLPKDEIPPAPKGLTPARPK